MKGEGTPEFGFDRKETEATSEEKPLPALNLSGFHNELVHGRLLISANSFRERNLMLINLIGDNSINIFKVGVEHLH